MSINTNMEMPEEVYYPEDASVYFNDIIRKDVKPINVDMLPAEVVDEFNEKVKDAFGDDYDVTVKRIRYLIPYILQNIDWNEYGIPLEAWQLQYYYHRNRFLAKTGLSYARFEQHEPLQNAIEALGLEPEPTFEFILFLKHYYSLRAELHFTPVELLKQAIEASEASTGNAAASIDINVNGQHFKITGIDAVKKVLGSIDVQRLTHSNLKNDFTHGGNRDKLRTLDYYLIKTLLDYLPIKRESARRGMFCQDERNFGLSVLSLCGRLPDVDREGVCSKENNATFDKLMRDFRNTPIPYAMELFL